MSLTRIIKSQARAALAGFRGRAAVILVVAGILRMGINLLDAAVFRMLGYDVQMRFFAGGLRYAQSFVRDPWALGVCLAACLARLIILVPLGIGIINWYLELTDRRARPVSHIFWPYENRVCLRSIGLRIALLLRLVVYGALILWAPVVGTVAGIGLLTPGGMAAVSDFTVGAAVLAVGLPMSVLLWAFMGRYDLAPMLLCQKYRMTVRQALRTSVRMTQGYRWQLLGFKLTFLWWFVPAALLGGASLWMSGRWGWELLLMLAVFLLFIYSAVAFLVAFPYYRMSHTMLCRYLYEAGQRAENFCREKSGEKAPEGSLRQEEQDPLSSPIVVPEDLSKGEDKENDPKYYL